MKAVKIVVLLVAVASIGAVGVVDCQEHQNDVVKFTGHRDTTRKLVVSNSIHNMFCQMTTAVASAADCPIVCQFGISFSYPHLQDCGRYYRCQNGRLLEFACGASAAVFDMRTLRCQSAHSARCVLPAE